MTRSSDRIFRVPSRVPLNTCRGRAVGLLHDWQGGYVKTVSGYGKRVQHRPIRLRGFVITRRLLRIDL